MSKKKFYILTVIEYIVYKFIYIEYYLLTQSYFREHPISTGLYYLLMVAPILILLALAIITLEIGYKRLQEWKWKQKLLTIFLIIFIQLIPVWFL